ncbi:calcium-binding protein [Actinoplanes sp. NPDC049668]|uniref:calcium-binding protein n=1 Tax=unclassified Actinoplanes TaxID=2626549 RepID=UPI0033A37071
MLLTTVSMGALAAPAQGAPAGVVTVVEKTKVQYKAASGKQNKVVVTRSGRTITIDDKVAIRAGKGCKKVKGDKTKVRCTLSKTPTRVRVYTYDRNDSVVNKSDLPMTADGGTASDSLTGGPRGDRLIGGTGADRLYGLGGKDYLDGRNGNDRIYGGDGADTIHGWLGDDTARGGNGDDYVWGEEGNDKLYGDAGNDDLNGYQGRDRLEGGAGDDWLTGDVYSDGTAADVLLGGPGADEVNYGGYEKAVTIDLDGSARDDGLAGEHDTVGADVERIYGGWAGDRLTGNAADNRIMGYTGNDIIYGGAGNDELYGLDGRDKLYGGAGDDWLDGDDLPEVADRLDGGANGPLGDECLPSRHDTVVGCER